MISGTSDNFRVETSKLNFASDWNQRDFDTVQFLLNDKQSLVLILTAMLILYMYIYLCYIYMFLRFFYNQIVFDRRDNIYTFYHAEENRDKLYRI